MYVTDNTNDALFAESLAYRNHPFLLCKNWWLLLKRWAMCDIINHDITVL